MSLKEYYEKNRTEILNDYFDLLRFKSISTDKQYKAQTRSCADWLVNYLKNIGMSVELWETSGHPVVFGEDLKAGPDRPTVLIYNHYDVQPVDPLELWHSDPFEPILKDGHVYARGAVDNKGQCAYTIAALKAVLQKLNINVKIFIEGEEESGGKGTFEILETKKKKLKADYLLIVDFGLPAPDTPAITLGTRGLLALELVCKNSSIDLHSGVHGGIALNPNRALACAIAKLWDDEGRVAVPGFYDDVSTLKECNELYDHFDVADYTKKFGVKAFCPEKGYSLLESNWTRPTLEINGMSGGYTGDGFKTVIPFEARAKISCRLVPNQDPGKIVKQIRDFLKTAFPKGIEMDLIELQGTSAYRSSFDTPLVKTVAKAFEEVFNKKCKYMLCGASVPIVPSLALASGAQTALIGCGLDDDNIHAPNERFGLDRFEQGFLTLGTILQCLST